MYLFNTCLCKNLLRAEGLDEGRAALRCILNGKKNLSKGTVDSTVMRGRGTWRPSIIAGYLFVVSWFLMEYLY